jgi:hypothetical protein
MLNIMEMSSVRALDEACNHHNDAYGDEVLYASWITAPQSDVRLAEIAASTYREPVGVNLEGFMARLYACQ